MKEKTVSELKQMRDDGLDFQLIDVREEHEFDMCNLEGDLIPLGSLLTDIEKIRKDVPVIVHCRSGSRSGRYPSTAKCFASAYW